MTETLSSWLQRARSYTSDSRVIHDPSVFVALKGEQSDGHAFVLKLLSNSALRGFVISRDYFDTNKPILCANRPEGDFWIVADTHEAHREIAAHFRKRFLGPVIAVGGSSGKTSCKEFLVQILKGIGKKTAATYKSQNGELGIPKTLESLHSGIDVAVVEIGIDGPGDMIRHVDIVRPNFALLTSIGEEHLNLLKSIQGVFDEEKILFDKTIEAGGKCFAPASDLWLAKIKSIQLVPDTPEQVDPIFTTNLTGIFSKRNAALAAAVCFHIFPRERDSIAAALKTLQVPEGRGRVVTDSCGRIWVEDHYNSNPSSLRAALLQSSVLKKTHLKNVTLVLGDMLDLGDQSVVLHRSLIEDLRAVAPERIVLIGPMMSALKSEIEKFSKNIETYSSSEEAARLGKFVDWSRTVTVFKGSRGMALEKVLKAFQESEFS